MSVAPHPLADATGNGTANMAQVAMAQVEPQLFKRIADFRKGVVPAHHLIATLQIINMFDDVARMVQREREFIAWHSKDAAQSSRHGLQFGSEMSAVGSQPDIVHKVPRRHDAERRAEQEVSPIDGFEVFSDVLFCRLSIKKTSRL